MSNTKHTPGEWLILPPDNGDASVGLQSSSGAIYAEMPDGTVVEICTIHTPIYMAAELLHKYDDGDRYYGDEGANARLIAAAPRLYKACETFCEKVESGQARSSQSYREMKAILDAIDAKAEGAD